MIGFDKKILFYAVKRPYSYRSPHGPEDNFERAVQREFIRCFIVLTCSRLGVVDIGTTGEPERPYLPGRPEWGSFNQTSSDNMRCVTKEGEKRRAWETKASHIVFRFTDLGREALFGEKEQKKNKIPSMLIGADFEIIVEKTESSPAIMMELSMLCEARPGHSSDSVVRFQLNRESLISALQAGRSIDDIIAFLNENWKKKVPENVLDSLRDWSTRFGKISLFIDRDLLEFETGKERDNFVKEQRDAKPVGTFFALSERVDIAGQENNFFNYEHVPVRCVNVFDTGVISIDRTEADLIIDNEVARYATKDGVDGNLYRINRKSVSSSRLSEDAILKSLKDRSKTKVPKALAISILGWKKLIPPLESATLRILAVPETPLLDAMLEKESIRKHIIGKLTNKHIVVQRDSYDDLVSALGEMGIEISEALRLHPIQKGKERGC